MALKLRIIYIPKNNKFIDANHLHRNLSCPSDKWLAEQYFCTNRYDIIDEENAEFSALWIHEWNLPKVWRNEHAALDRSRKGDDWIVYRECSCPT